MPPYERPRIMPAPQQPRLQGSPQQDAIWEEFAHGKSHLIIEALAGTGKTTTGVEGLRRIPAGQQAAFLAFNKSIATELQSKVPQGVKAATFHSVGYGACMQQFGKLEVDGDRTWKMLPENMPKTTRSLICKLVGLCKNVLDDGMDRNRLLDLCAQYDIDLYGEDEWDDTAEIVLNWVPQILEKSKQPVGSIDFDDMIWLPVIWRLPVKKYDVLVVDESQDLNRTQQELALMVGRRIIMVGDSHQAIYGFRGADTNSMQTLADRLQATPLGLKVLPLTVTRRCPKSVTILAAKIVPEFECMPEAKWGRVCFGDALMTDDGGKVTQINGEDYVCSEPTPQRGDLVVCRVNAPLVQLAYSLIRQQVPVKIQGRDLGTNLANLIKKLVPEDATCAQLLRELYKYRDKEARKIAEANGGTRAETALQALEDKVQCIEALTDGLDTVPEVLSRIRLLFTEVEKGNTDGFVLLSSVHRAKGLEARVVRIIKPELLPHPMARLPWQQEQERNLKYVAITRSLEVLHIHD